MGDSEVEFDLHTSSLNFVIVELLKYRIALALLFALDR